MIGSHVVCSHAHLCGWTWARRFKSCRWFHTVPLKHRWKEETNGGREEEDDHCLQVNMDVKGAGFTVYSNTEEVHNQQGACNDKYISNSRPENLLRDSSPGNPHCFTVCVNAQ